MLSLGGETGSSIGLHSSSTQHSTTICSTLPLRHRVAYRSLVSLSFLHSAHPSFASSTAIDPLWFLTLFGCVWLMPPLTSPNKRFVESTHLLSSTSTKPLLRYHRSLHHNCYTPAEPVRCSRRTRR
ncbi:hypothetical protein BJY04DRAFT_105903 [Aspergillus karnatakaensis]|uniref:uncharacterized protein n=1 Tax=Aspergillus karnatakaensis TaxID=1810916 RepID=UPI003CCDF498